MCQFLGHPVRPFPLILHQHDFKGWAENQRIMLYEKTWFFTLTSPLNACISIVTTSSLVLSLSSVDIIGCICICESMYSGVGTNLKGGGWHRSRAKLRGTDQENFLVVPLPFLALKHNYSRFGERFCDGQYSLISLMFAVLLLTVPPCPMESAPLSK